MFGADFESRNATNIDDYKLTCMQFMNEISSDYKDWVKRYDLPEEENGRRVKAIDEVVKITSEWIGRFGDTVKKIDVIKDDGINKMAEFTAGYPFELMVNVGNQTRYAQSEAGQIRLDVLARPRADNKKVRIAYYSKDQFVQILSSAPVSVNESQVNFEPKAHLNEPVVLDAGGCEPSDVVSITIIVEEVLDDVVADKRGVTTLLLIK